MKRISIFLLLFVAFMAQDVLAQEEEELTIKVGGFVRYEAYYESYESVTTRDGALYLYPKEANLSSDGVDLNDHPTLNMLGLVSRFNIKTSGYTVLGAKASSLIEGDFFGTGQAYTRLFRLRHALIKLNWDNTELLMGHTWHPMFVTACFPGTLTFAAGVPFNPLNRSAQVRGTFKLGDAFTISGSLLTHTYHKSSGPGEAQRNAGLPDMQFQAILSPGDLVVGVTAGYKLLRPRLVTDTLNFATSETIGSYNLQGFLKYSGSNFSFKAMAVYGQNLTNFVTIGGYGAAQNPTLVDDYSYNNLKTFTAWTDITILKNPQIGLFAGYAANLGADGDYFNLGYVRSANLASTYRVSPRITYKVKNITFGFELQYSVAVYGATFDNSYKALTMQDPTSSVRCLALAQYSF